MESNRIDFGEFVHLDVACSAQPEHDTQICEMSAASEAISRHCEWQDHRSSRSGTSESP